MPETLLAATRSAVKEAPADFSELLSCAYTLGEMINRSAAAEQYVYWKRKVAEDEEAKRAAKRLAQAKDIFTDCERFGRFHPDYNEALDRVYAAEAELDKLECVRRFKAVERELDELLHEISFTVARSVSESVKVPDADPNAKGGGCGSGGSCSCGGGGCG